MELHELEDKLLFDEVNRRLKLLKTVQGGRQRFEWHRLTHLIYLIPLSVLAYTLGRDAFNHDQILALLLITSLITSLASITEPSIDARMDALVKLLREDGILRDTPPGARRSEKS